MKSAEAHDLESLPIAIRTWDTAQLHLIGESHLCKRCPQSVADSAYGGMCQLHPAKAPRQGDLQLVGRKTRRDWQRDCYRRRYRSVHRRNSICTAYSDAGVVAVAGNRAERNLLGALWHGTRTGAARRRGARFCDVLYCRAGADGLAPIAYGAIADPTGQTVGVVAAAVTAALIIPMVLGLRGALTGSHVAGPTTET